MIDLAGLEKFGEAAAVDEQGRLMAILVRVSPTQWRPERCFASAAQLSK
jgi:hypothetical protein